MSRAAEDRLPLTGADAFLLAFDGETRRRNRANHLSQIVLRLGPGFAPDAFARVLAEVVEANPITSPPARRGLRSSCTRRTRCRPATGMRRSRSRSCSRSA
ncbi:MAG: hypothetical protein E6J87_01440 [Deltaproteobacteria bacterium]|nr:MAG: hypothetical protein E6J87_01440 [Deltaproteobacteria bacterium]